jgi:hypothetical protein
MQEVSIAEGIIRDEDEGATESRLRPTTLPGGLRGGSTAVTVKSSSSSHDSGAGATTLEAVDLISVAFEGSGSLARAAIVDSRALI